MTGAGLRERLLTVADDHPDRIALWVDNEHFRYRDLYDRAWRLAGVLSDWPEPFCLVYSGKNLTRYVAILASVLAGKVFVPLCPTSPTSYCTRVLDQLAGQATAIVDSGDAHLDGILMDLLDPAAPVVSAKPSARAERSVELHEAMTTARRPADVRSGSGEAGAYLMFTSGSTGVPKAVLVTGQNLSSYLDGAAELFAPVPEDRFAQVNNFTFDLAMHDIFLAWSTGASVYAFADSAAYKLPELLRRHETTFWLSVPTTGLSLANLGLLQPGSLPHLRCSLFCGEPLPQRVARAWHTAAPQSRLFNVYGPTECTIAVTAFEWDPAMDLPDVVPIGWPYPGQSACVVDDRLRVLAPDQTGELVLRGSQTAAGYYGNPEQTASRFVEIPRRSGIWYRTGDWVTRDERWGLLFKGRRDDQLQVRGVRIERLEVETLIKGVLGTDSVAVVGWPIQDGNLVQGLVAFVADIGVAPAVMRRLISAELPEHMWPSQIHIGELPQTRSRKVDYTALRRRLAEAEAAGRNRA